MNSPARRRSSPTAFTLVEILIVVVILGILSGILMTLIRGKTAEARAVTLDQQFQRIQQALALYEQQHGRLPLQLSELAPPADAAPIAPAEASMITLRETNDPWGNPFVYDPEGSIGGYTLLSYGSDGLPGGEGEAADQTR